MREAQFFSAASIESPFCGEINELTKSDVTVVEFRLENNGSVSSATPIYTTGGRPIALAFAKAVGRWSWTPESIKAIPAFFRTARVEMRCSTSKARPSVLAPLVDETSRWITSTYSIFSGMDESPAKVLPLAIAELRRAEAVKDEKAIFVALMYLGMSVVAPVQDRIGYIDRASEIADRIAPASVRTLIATQKIGLKQNRHNQFDRQEWRQLLQQPYVQNDALSAATVRLTLAAPFYRFPAPPDADDLLNQVVSDGRLEALHPLKINALLQLATRAAARNDLASAQNYFSKTGLAERQCGLLGITPALRKDAAGPSDYPMEAMRMGFEGWVRTEFDIAADGKTIDPRAIVSYPPFVFDNAATGIARDLRFQATFRPGASAACSANQRSFGFRLR